MARTVYDPNPHISILDDGTTKKKIAEQAQRALEMADRLKEHTLTAEQIEAERFQYESNTFAEENPLYAAARAASASFLVVPLDGASPLVDPSEATRDPRQLLAWWQQYHEANPGVLLGRIGGLWALRVEDNEAWARLKEMAIVHRRDGYKGRYWMEDKGIGGARVRLLAPSQPFSVRARGGWGEAFDQAVFELAREDRNRHPQTGFLVWSYPAVQSGEDAFDYRSRTIGAGLKVLGEGEVLPWQGSILEGGIEVQAPMSRPPEAPLWLAKIMGRPRSRKAMAAAREQYEADLRSSNAYWMGVVRAQREAGERALWAAQAEREKAATALQKAEADRG